MSTPVNSCFVSADAAKTMSIEELFEELQSSNHGLGSIAAASRLASCGPNLLKEKKRSALLKFLRYFWGPIPWMIELAGILSAILHHWPNFIIILVLLLVNGLVGFFEEHQAGNAIEALKKKLALKSLVKRDGNWSEIEAAEIVPGDIVRVRLGNIIPADLRLLDGDYLIVDQSTLTGESLPVSKKIGDIAYSGSIAKQGEVEALVISTGQNTFFGKTAKLVEEAGSVSHFQRAVLAIGNYLIHISLSLAVLLIIVQLLRGNSFLSLAQFVLILIVASIPVAMPAVLSMTMALGALKLSRMKAIVTKLESIEEMAGIDVLCCDKTGTLTQNELKLGDRSRCHQWVQAPGTPASVQADQISPLRPRNQTDGGSHRRPRRAHFLCDEGRPASHPLSLRPRPCLRKRCREEHRRAGRKRIPDLGRRQQRR